MNDEDLHALHRLRWSLQVLAAPPKQQLSLWPDFADKPRELADDFDNWWRAIRWRTDLGLDAARQVALAAIDARLASLSPQAWTDQAVRSDAAWSELRELAKCALAACAWSAELSPGD